MKNVVTLRNKTEERKKCDKCLFHCILFLWIRIRSNFSNNTWNYVNDRKLIFDNDDDISFSSSSSSLSLKHTSQELDSNTAKLLLENQLKYSSRILISLNLNYRSLLLSFIHLPTNDDSNGRKSNDVRLIGIVVPIFLVVVIE